MLMYACLDRVGLAFLNIDFYRSGLSLQKTSYGVERRRLRHPSSSLSGEDLPASTHRSKGNMEPYKSPSEDHPREEPTQRPHSRRWYGKNGEIESTLPCPNCRGRGYVPCPLCGIATPDLSCTECHGKGLKTCSRCEGRRAILLQPMYEELSWKPSTARGPLHEIEDDDAIEDMDIKVAPDRKSKRIYSSHSVEVREKIRQALKSLDARTGSVTERMRKIHNDPVLNAKRIAGIKKAKSTEASRKSMSEKTRLFFQDPRNRVLRSIRLKGADYYCGLCGKKGHRKNNCPEIGGSVANSHHCSLCGQAGHKRPTCQVERKAQQTCSICKKVGHTARRCPQKHGKADVEQDKV